MIAKRPVNRPVKSALIAYSFWLGFLIFPTFICAQSSDIHQQATGILLDYLDETDASIKAARKDRIIKDQGIARAQYTNDSRETVNLSGKVSYSDIDQKVGNAPKMDSDFSNQDLTASLGITKTLMDWGRQDSKVRIAQLERSNSEHIIRENVERIYLISLQAYYRTVRAIARVDLSKQSLENLRSKLNENRQRFQAGVSNVTDVMIAEAGLALGESKLAQENATFESAISDLKSRAPAGFESYLPEKITLPSPHERLQEISLNEALEDQQKSSPSLAASLHAIEIAKAQLEDMKLHDSPKVGLSVNLTRQQGYGNTSSANTVGSAAVSMDIPIFRHGTTQSDINRLTAQVQKAHLQHRANIDIQQLSLKRIWNEFHALGSGLKALKQNVTAREELLKRARQAQEVGQFNESQVLNEEERLLEARLLLIDSEFQQLSKGLEIINLIGWPLRDFL